MKPNAAILKNVCLLSCLVGVIGCASPKGAFTCKKEPGCQDRLERVLVVYYVDEGDSPLGPPFADTFLLRLTELLRHQGVASESARPDRKALDGDASVRSNADRFQPRHLLQFTLARVETATSEYRSALVPLSPMTFTRAVAFRFVLFDYPRDRVIWRGEVGYAGVPSAAVVADQLMKQLEAEQFLSVRSEAGR